MTIDWTKAPKEAQWYQPATGLVNAAWFYKDEIEKIIESLEFDLGEEE